MTIQEAAEKYGVSTELINQYLHRSNVPVSHLIQMDSFTKDGEKWLQKHFARTGYISYFEDTLYSDGTEYDDYDDEESNDESTFKKDDDDYSLISDPDGKTNDQGKNDDMNLDFTLDFDRKDDTGENSPKYEDLNFSLELDEKGDIEELRSDTHVPLSGYLAEFRKALQDEIAAIKKSGQSSTLLYGGHVIARKGNDTWYQFRIQYMPNIPADTPCKLFVGSSSYEVTVINVEETSIILSTTENIPETIAEAQLENGSTVLMELLIKRIEKNSTKDASAGKRMLEGTNVPKDQLFQKIHDCSPEIAAHFTLAQRKAIISGLSNNITYIWGPPGTGKTSVIGTLITELFKAGRSVLLVSHTNTAVDGAIKKVDKEYSRNNAQSECAMYPFLRLGIPADKDMPDRLLMQSHVEMLGKELYTTRELLLEKQLKKQEKKARIEHELQEAGWVYSNNVQTLIRVLAEAEAQEEKVTKLTSSFAEIRRKFHAEKANHPEYQNLSELKMQLKKLEDHYSLLKKKQIDIKNHQTRTEMELQTAKDAVVQHKEYAALKERESQMMSLSAQEKRIQDLKADIAALEKEKKELQANIKIVIAQIEDYEQSGFLGRIGKKKTYETNVDMRKQLEDRIDGLSVSLPTKYDLLRKYDEEVRTTRLLKAQIEGIHLSATLQYWEMQLQKSEEAHKRYADSFNQLLKEIEQVNNQLSRLRGNIQKVEIQCQSLVAAEREYSSCLSLLKEAKDALNLLEEKLDQAYHAEIEKTYLFFLPGGKSIKENVNFLQVKLDELSYKYINVSVENLAKENESVQGEILDLQQKINEIEQKLSGLEKQVIMEANVIGTTLAKSYLNDPLQERRFDTVILDEASMASIPALWCASCLAESNIVIVGDFLQLAPIVIADTPEAKEWLGKDIFEKSGMVARLKRKEQPENFVMLNDQFRMEKEIADIANNLYYSQYGGLKSNDHTAVRDKERAEFQSWYSGNIEAKHSIHLIDTESMHAWVTGIKQGKGHSRFNCFSAALDVNIAFTLVESRLNNELVSEPAVLIVVPYKPHANLVQKMIDLEYQNRGLENQNLINVGTVHSFQGKEADIVIFDLVVDEPHWKANLFMPDDVVGDSLDRMFNVAVTRAKFELFVVGNFKYCMGRAKSNSLGRFLTYLRENCRLQLWDAKKLFPKMKYIYRDNSISTDDVEAAHLLCRDDSFDHYLKKDLLNAKNRIIIYSPFMTEDRVSILLPYFDDARRRGVTIVIVTKATGELNKPMATQKKRCETLLSKHGIHMIHRKGMHEKIILIDNTVVWNGSLNVLSFSGSTSEVMERFACTDKSSETNNIFNSYVQAYDIEQMLEIVQDESQGFCPICHGQLLFCEGANGEMYWECEGRDYSRPASQPYPKDGELHCKRCGGRFCYKRKNEPRWVCRNNSAHYQKLRKDDLKLPKMAALIPSANELEKINEYFAQL